MDNNNMRPEDWAELRRSKYQDRLPSPVIVGMSMAICTVGIIILIVMWALS